MKKEEKARRDKDTVERKGIRGDGEKGGGRGRRKRRAPLGDRKWEETFKGAILGPGPFQE